MQGLVAMILSLKKKPVIRYEKMSSMARKLAHELQVQFFAFYIDSPYQLALESHPSRVPTVRFPVNPDSTSSPHP